MVEHVRRQAPRDIGGGGCEVGERGRRVVHFRQAEEVNRGRLTDTL